MRAIILRVAQADDKMTTGKNHGSGNFCRKSPSQQSLYRLAFSEKLRHDGGLTELRDRRRLSGQLRLGQYLLVLG